MTSTTTGEKIKEDGMRPVPVMTGSKFVQRIAAVACVVALGVGLAACGSSTKTSTQNAPSTSGSTGATTAASSGGAGF